MEFNINTNTKKVILKNANLEDLSRIIELCKMFDPDAKWSFSTEVPTAPYPWTPDQPYIWYTTGTGTTIGDCSPFYRPESKIDDNIT